MILNDGFWFWRPLLANLLAEQNRTFKKQGTCRGVKFGVRVCAVGVACFVFVCVQVSSVCRAGALCKFAEISRKQEKSGVPICGCFRCTFSLRTSRDAHACRRAGGIGPRFHANARVNRAVAVTGWRLLKWSAGSGRGSAQDSASAGGS